jgi:dihydropyrimidine dehydrogenase (NAD+) subunit PreA
MNRDLSVKFCGLDCENPFFLSSSCVSGNYEMCARALEMGWGGIVYKTVGFYIPNEVSPRFDATKRGGGMPFSGFRNLEQISDHPLRENLDAMRRLKLCYPNKIMVASIMGETDAQWTELARLCEEAGVDMIECNFSCPQMTKSSMGSDVGQSAALVESYCRAVRQGTKLPILAKMTPNLGNMEEIAVAAIKGGADSIAAINTVKSITQVDCDSLSGCPSVDGHSTVSGYSGRAVKPIALRFIHDLAKHPALSGVPISGIGGIESFKDALEFLLLGASNIQITTSVMEYGYRIIGDLISGLSEYMQEKGVTSIAELVGKALPSMVTSDTLRRDSLVLPVFDRESCVGCGRCYLSCRDGGHQAIAWEDTKRLPSLIHENCVGCHLCVLVCPTQAIAPGARCSKH